MKIASIWKGIKTRIEDFLYNEDRSIASLAGAPPQETISSEVGRHEALWVDKEAADALNAIQKGHTEHAVEHANALDKADDGFRG